MNKGQIVRHGDVLLVPAEIPTDAVSTGEKQEQILAEGEVTGHAHRLSCDMPIDLLVKGAQRYLRVPREARLAHEEHKALSIVPGTYEISIEKEYDYFEQQRKTVVD